MKNCVFNFFKVKNELNLMSPQFKSLLYVKNVKSGCTFYNITVADTVYASFVKKWKKI